MIKKKQEKLEKREKILGFRFFRFSCFGRDDRNVTVKAADALS